MVWFMVLQVVSALIELVRLGRSIEIKPKQHLIRLAAGSQIDLGGTDKGLNRIRATGWSSASSPSSESAASNSVLSLTSCVTR
jgi:hypothetical protein